MKLLLTSGGISNQSIADALLELLGKPFSQTSITFIPTAANVEMGDKSWLIDDLVSLRQLGFKSISIVDVTAIDESVWRPQIEEVDVIFVEGGNTFYLMEQFIKSGFAQELPALLSSKVYVGVSAGSIIVSKNLMLRTSQELYQEDLDRTDDIQGLNLVDLYVVPHYRNEYFALGSEEHIRQAIGTIEEKVYVLDDESALKIVDSVVEVVTEGAYFVI